MAGDEKLGFQAEVDISQAVLAFGELEKAMRGLEGSARGLSRGERVNVLDDSHIKGQVAGVDRAMQEVKKASRTVNREIKRDLDELHQLNMRRGVEAASGARASVDELDRQIGQLTSRIDNLKRQQTTLNREQRQSPLTRPGAAPAFRGQAALQFDRPTHQTTTHRYGPPAAHQGPSVAPPVRRHPHEHQARVGAPLGPVGGGSMGLGTLTALGMLGSLQGRTASAAATGRAAVRSGLASFGGYLAQPIRAMGSGAAAVTTGAAQTARAGAGRIAGMLLPRVLGLLGGPLGAALTVGSMLPHLLPGTGFAGGRRPGGAPTAPGGAGGGGRGGFFGRIFGGGAPGGPGGRGGGFMGRIGSGLGAALGGGGLGGLLRGLPGMMMGGVGMLAGILPGVLMAVLGIGSVMAAITNAVSKTVEAMTHETNIGTRLAGGRSISAFSDSMFAQGKGLGFTRAEAITTAEGLGSSYGRNGGIADKDVGAAMRFTRGLGMTVEQTTGMFGNAGRQGVFGNGELERFSMQLAASIDKSDMLGRAAEAMEASVGILGGMSQRIGDLSDKQRGGMLALQAKLAAEGPEMFRGQAGAGFINTLSGAFQPGSRGEYQDTLFNLALTQFGGMKGAHPVDVMLRREEGATPENLKAVGSMARQYSGGDDKLMMSRLVEMFGISFHQAKELMKSTNNLSNVGSQKDIDEALKRGNIVDKGVKTQEDAFGGVVRKARELEVGFSELERRLGTMLVKPFQAVQEGALAAGDGLMGFAERLMKGDNPLDPNGKNNVWDFIGSKIKEGAGRMGDVWNQQIGEIKGLFGSMVTPLKGYIDQLVRIFTTPLDSVFRNKANELREQGGFMAGMGANIMQSLADAFSSGGGAADGIPLGIGNGQGVSGGGSWGPPTGPTAGIVENMAKSGVSMQQLKAVADKYGVPMHLALGLIRAESTGNQSARSPVGAVGLMQLMPRTAKGLGVNPHDPHQNIDGGMRYLADLKRQFGSWEGALAAYNGGPGAFGRAGGNLAAMAPETREYVPKVLGFAEQAKKDMATGNGAPVQGHSWQAWQYHEQALGQHGHITSTGRSPAHNAEVKGVAGSFHTTHQAVDIVPKSKEHAAAIYEYARKNNMEVIPYGDGHLHLEPKDSRVKALGYKPKHAHDHGPDDLPKESGGKGKPAYKPSKPAKTSAASPGASLVTSQAASTQAALQMVAMGGGGHQGPVVQQTIVVQGGDLDAVRRATREGAHQGVTLAEAERRARFTVG